jgi:peptidoglycan lytic transglycosylase A
MHGFRPPFRLFLPALLACCWIMACARTPVPPQPPPAALTRLKPADYPRFADDDGFRQLSQSIAMSLAYLRRLPPQTRIYFGADPYPADHLIRSLEYFDRIIQNQPSVAVLNRVIAAHFLVYRSIGRSVEKDVLFTGYYEPLLQGSLKPGPDFPVPVHSRPADLVKIDLGAFAPDLKGRSIVGQYTGQTVVPYPTRGQLLQRADFDKIAPPLVWLKDEIDLFTLQVQGSGRVVLDTGGQFNIHYDGSNGRPYRSIGRLLIDQGRIPADKMSMQAIRDYLRQNPKVARDIMNHNARYIFFKKATEGPLGALGQLLTPMRSVAVDRSILPSAALAFISLPLPRVDRSGAIEGWSPYHGFVLAQDAGGAILGPGRVDLFMGLGPAAETAASHLRHPGRLYFLVLDPQAMP